MSDLSESARRYIRISVDALAVVVVVAAAHFFPREVVALVIYGCWKELDCLNGGGRE